MCSVIISKLSQTRRALTDSLVFNADIMQNHELLIARLKDVAEEEEEEPRRKEKSALALNSTRTRPPSGCRNGKHHPEATCWSMHPEMRPIRKPRNNPSQHHTSVPSTSANTSRVQPVTSQFEKPAFGHITTATMLSVTPQTLPVVLDSGASHHMFNKLEFFIDTRACSTPISTGKNSADLMATLEGTASIMDSTGKIIQLPGSLYVPGLSRNLLSLGTLSKNSISIDRQGDTSVVTIDQNIRFNCHMVNGILEVKECIGPIPSTPTVFSTTTHSSKTSTYETWHSGIARLKVAISNAQLTATPNCDVCMKGKIT
jgi:hypothetical protein